MTRRTVEVFHDEGGRWVTLAASEGDTAVRADPFPEAEIDLLVLWGQERGEPPWEVPRL